MDVARPHRRGPSHAPAADELVDELGEIDRGDELEDGLQDDGSPLASESLSPQPELRGWAKVRLAVKVGNVWGAGRLRQFVHKGSYWFTTPSDNEPGGRRGGALEVRV